MTKSRVLALLVLLTSGACREPWPDATLVLAVPTPIRTVDPRLAVDAASTRVWRLVFSGLTAVHPDGSTSLDLAEAITPSAWDGEGAPVAYDVTLRRDRRFHDGRPVEAADVVCTYRSLVDPRLGSPVGGAFARRFTAVEALGPRRVRFRLRAPLATFRSDVILGIVPRSACRHPRLALGAAVGAGPFRLQEPLEKDRVVLQRVGSAPPSAARQVVVRAIADEGARALSVLGGGADVGLGLSPGALDAASRHGAARIASAPGIAFSYLGVQLEHPTLADPVVRRALLLALDRPALVAAVLGGRGRVAATMMAPEHWAAPADLQPVASDPARVATLLDTAGLPPDAGGIRLRLRLLTTTARERRTQADAVARQLARVGVAVEVRGLEIASLLDALRAGQFDLFLLGLPEPLEPDYLGWMFHSRNRPGAALALPAPLDDAARAIPGCRRMHAAATADALVAIAWDALGSPPARGSGNRSRLRDPRIDCLLDLGQRAQTLADRAPHYHAVARLLARLLPVLPLWHEDASALVGARVGAVSPPADGSYLAWTRAPLTPRAEAGTSPAPAQEAP